MKLIDNKFGSILKKITTHCDVWILGSSLVDKEALDIDVFVPIEEWQLASSYIPSNAKINSLGGFKFLDDNNINVDIWTGLMGDFLNSDRFTVCYNPRTGIKIGRINNN